MKTFAESVRFLVRLVALGAIVAMSAHAQVTLFTTSASEGLAYRTWFSGNDTWIASSATSYSVHYDPTSGGKYSSMPVFNFSLADLSGQSVTSATLHLYTGGTGTNATFLVNDYSVANNVAGSANATYAQSLGGNVLGDITGSAPTWYHFDVTSDINYAVAHGWSWLAINVTVTYPSSGIANGSIGGFGSAFAPSITASAVPEPATTTAIAGVLAIAAAWAARCRRIGIRSQR